MAIVAPVLVAIFFAIVEFGSILYTQHTLAEASRSINYQFELFPSARRRAARNAAHAVR